MQKRRLLETVARFFEEPAFLCIMEKQRPTWKIVYIRGTLFLSDDAHWDFVWGRHHRDTIAITVWSFPRRP